MSASGDDTNSSSSSSNKISSNSHSLHLSFLHSHSWTGLTTPSVASAFSSSSGIMATTFGGHSANINNGNPSSASAWMNSGSNGHGNNSSEYQRLQPHSSSSSAQSSYLMHANTPPIATNSILFSPAGLPPRHQPTLDSTLPSSVDYFTLVSPSGTVQALPQQQQQDYRQTPSKAATHHAPHSYPSMVRPADTLLGPSSMGSSMRPRLSHLAPLSMQSSPQYQSHYHAAPQQASHHQQGWTGPFSHPIPVQPSNLSNSLTAHANSGAPAYHSHNRGISTSSFTSSSSRSMDSLTWSPVGSPTSSSYSQASSFQPQDNFMLQNNLERVPSPPSGHNYQYHAYQHAKGPPSYMYGHPLEQLPHHEQYSSAIFDARYQADDQPQYQGSDYYQQIRQSPSQVPTLDHQYLQQPDFSYSSSVRSSVSPVLMSLSPPQISDELSLQPLTGSGGMGGITPTNANFNMIAPTPRLPSLITRAVAALDDDLASPMSPSRSDEDDEENDKGDDTMDAQERASGEVRQLRRGRSGGSLSLSSLSQQQQQSPHKRQRERADTSASTTLSESSPSVVLPLKIKALGTLPANEAFSASLDQLDDVAPGTKPPYLWWTLIRAAILGAPEQKLQMETLTHLIQHKYPYFGSAKETKNWKSSIRSVIHTKPCFYKSEDEDGVVWWHVDPDIDPREQRRGMKKRSSISSGSNSVSPALHMSPEVSADAVEAVKSARRIHSRDDDDEDEEENHGDYGSEATEDDGMDESFSVKQSSSKKRRRSD